MLRRISDESANTPIMRGATPGALWAPGEARPEEARHHIHHCATANRPGDFLTGLFALAREIALRNPDLVLCIDELLPGFTEDQFLERYPLLAKDFAELAGASGAGNQRMKDEG